MREPINLFTYIIKSFPQVFTITSQSTLDNNIVIITSKIEACFKWSLSSIPHYSFASPPLEYWNISFNFAEMEVLSTGSDLCIEFIANSEFPGQGFKASFQFQPIEEVNSSGKTIHFMIPSERKLLFFLHNVDVKRRKSKCELFMGTS